MYVHAVKNFEQSCDFKIHEDSNETFRLLCDSLYYPLLNQGVNNEAGNLFVFSTTEQENDDDDGLLSQWRAYGRGGCGVGDSI